jgi:signal transduction histidine kinase
LGNPSVRIRPIISLACWLSLALLHTFVRGGWNDRIQGLPVLDRYSLHQLGQDSLPISGAQDDKGRLFFGANDLLVFDGIHWKRYSGPPHLSYIYLGAEHRVWVGGLDEIGYFDEDATGSYHYHTLAPQLPPDKSHFGPIWGIASLESRVYFFSTDCLLCWDGRKFTFQEYPTQRRLFPLRLGKEVWFVHPETGLYQITEAGPKLVQPASAITYGSTIYLYREGGELRVIGNEGIFTVGHPDSPLSPPELGAFGNEGRVSGVIPLPDGNYFIGSVNRGLAVISARGEIIHRFDQMSGLPGSVVMPLFLDREDGLWVSDREGLYRLDASGASSLFNERNGLVPGVTLEIAPQAAGLWVLNTSMVHKLEFSEQSTARFAALPVNTAGYGSILPWDQGLLLTKFQTLDLYHEGHISTEVRKPIGTLSSLWAYRHLPRSIIYRCDQSLYRLSENTAGGRIDEKLVQLPDYAEIQTEDDFGRLWLSTYKSGIIMFDPGMKTTRTFIDDQLAEGSHRYAALDGRAECIYFASNDVCYRIDARSLQRTRLGMAGGASLHRLRLSTDGTRLYALFTRTFPGGIERSGLGYFSLNETVDLGKWTELVAPGLERIGPTTALYCRSEEGTDALWIGGSDGILRVRPEALQPVHAPAALFLRGLTERENGGGISVFPYAKHKVGVHVETTEPMARATLLFETRLGGEDAPWSPPSARDSYEFSNLREGDYTFAVRSVNPAGMTSPVAEYRFRILPPWYRTNWAYGGGLLTLAAGVFALVRVRERRARERQAELERLVTERTAELVKANAAKDEFLAGISHEIRNPMNGVVGLTTAIDTSGLDEASRQRFTYLRHCATHLSNLLEDILDFSKVQAGAVTLDLKPFAPRALAESLTAITATESQQAGVPVETAVAPEVPGWLLGDAARIRQILLNFIINALKYAGRGEVCLTVWTRPVVAGQSEVTFAVSDDGPGLSAEEQKKLFTRFERGSAAREKRVSGAGLGLALCRQLAEKMGGKIWVESEPGHGATFFLALTLPVAEAPEKVAADLPETVQVKGTALVVDDEDYNRLALASHLAALGFSTVLAGEAEQALAEAKARKFDAVFLDFDLPGRPGPDIARALRLLPSYPLEVPIIAPRPSTLRRSGPSAWKPA